MFDDAKWSARRRVFAFFAVFLAIAMLLDVFGEADVLSHAVDEAGLAAVERSREEAQQRAGTVEHEMQRLRQLMQQQFLDCYGTRVRIV